MSRRRFGAGRLDRGRATHGAKWCFVTPEGEMINYAQFRAQHDAQPNAMPWPKRLKQLQSEPVCWIRFTSGKEAKHWLHLKMLERGGLIRNLQRQVKQPLDVLRPDGLKETIGHYISDFTYEEREPTENMATVKWRAVIAEVKGMPEDLWIWKQKHFEAQYGMSIRVV